MMLQEIENGSDWKKSILEFHIYPDDDQDNTEKLNKCLQVISSPGNEVTELIAPPGRYRFDGDIIIRSGTFLTANLAKCQLEKKPVVFLF